MTDQDSNEGIVMLQARLALLEADVRALPASAALGIGLGHTGTGHEQSLARLVTLAEQLDGLSRLAWNTLIAAVAEVADPTNQASECALQLKDALSNRTLPGQDPTSISAIAEDLAAIAALRGVPGFRRDVFLRAGRE